MLDPDARHTHIHKFHRPQPSSGNAHDSQVTSNQPSVRWRIPTPTPRNGSRSASPTRAVGDTWDPPRTPRPTAWRHTKKIGDRGSSELQLGKHVGHAARRLGSVVVGSFCSPLLVSSPRKATSRKVKRVGRDFIRRFNCNTVHRRWLCKVDLSDEVRRSEHSAEEGMLIVSSYLKTTLENKGRRTALLPPRQAFP